MFANTQKLIVSHTVVEIGSALNGRRNKLKKLLANPKIKVIIAELYPNNFKNRFLTKRKSPRNKDRKRPNINNMRSFTIFISWAFLKVKIPILEVVWV